MDSKHQVLHCTQPAKEMIEANGRLAIQQSFLSSKNQQCQMRLKAILKKANNPNLHALPSKMSNVMAIAGQKGNHLILSIIPLSQLSNCLGLQHTEATTAIFISLQDNNNELALSALAQLYQLTPRELKLCQAFVNHADLSEVAQELNLKRSSVRSLLKSVYSKTEQSSQAGLMRLLMAFQLNVHHKNSKTIQVH